MSFFRRFPKKQSFIERNWTDEQGGRRTDELRRERDELQVSWIVEERDRQPCNKFRGLYNRPGVGHKLILPFRDTYPGVRM